MSDVDRPGAETAAPGPPLLDPVGLGRWAWQVLRSRPGILLGAGALVMAVYLVLVAGVFVTMFAVAIGSGWLPEPPEPDTAGNPGAFFGLYFGLLALVAVVMIWPFAAAARVVLRVVDGGSPSVSTLLRPVRPLATLALGLLLGLGTLVGLVLCVLPGIAWLVITQFALPALVDGSGPLRSVRRSIGLVRRHLLSSVVTWVMAVGIASIASFVPLVGIVLAVPLVLLVQCGAYRWLLSLEEGPATALDA